MQSRIYALAMACVCLFFAGAAQAAEHARIVGHAFPLQRGWKMQRSLAVADAMWGPAPCGRVTIERNTWLVSFRESSALAAADADACIIYLRPSWHPRWFGEVCTVLLHERGHIDGYRDPTNVEDPEHSGDPNNLMAADYLLQVNFVRRHGRLREYRESGNWRCTDRGLAYLRRHHVRWASRAAAG